MNSIYFQTEGINPKYCDVGIFLENDPDYIHYLDEPCKIHVNEVKIIDKKNVRFNKKTRMYHVVSSD